MTTRLDWTFDPTDPCRKGTYLRKIDDISKGLEALRAENLPEPVRFMTLYFGCEKLAKMMIGINLRRSATDPGDRKLHILELYTAVEDLKIAFTAQQVERLFRTGRDDLTVVAGRALRDRLTHDFGPTQVQRMEEQTSELTPLARIFLSRAGDVQNVLWDWWRARA
jgi:hypothetical protein